MQYAIALLILLSVISPSWQQGTFLFPYLSSHFSAITVNQVINIYLVTTGYITKTEYQITGCSSSEAIRTMSFKVNTCNPTFGVIARYTPGEAKPFSLQYFSDNNCQVPTSQGFHVEDGCEIGTSTATVFKYHSSSFPAAEGLVSFAAYDPSTNACDGNVFFFQQTLPTWYDTHSPSLFLSFSSTLLFHMLYAYNNTNYVITVI